MSRFIGWLCKGTLFILLFMYPAIGLSSAESDCIVEIFLCPYGSENAQYASVMSDGTVFALQGELKENVKPFSVNPSESFKSTKEIQTRSIEENEVLQTIQLLTEETMACDSDKEKFTFELGKVYVRVNGELKWWYTQKAEAPAGIVQLVEKINRYIEPHIWWEKWDEPSEKAFEQRVASERFLIYYIHRNVMDYEYILLEGRKLVISQGTFLNSVTNGFSFIRDIQSQEIIQLSEDEEAHLKSLLEAALASKVEEPWFLIPVPRAFVHSYDQTIEWREYWSPEVMELMDTLAAYSSYEENTPSTPDE